MIAFLQPLALLGLAAVAIPTLLHLMGRRLPPVVVFPAVRYLTETEREHSRRLKLRNLLLLILRTAMILFLVLAAARPVSPLGRGASHPPTAVALVIDNSLSSGAVVEGRRVLDWIRDAAGRTLDRLESGDRVWVVLADGLPRRLSRPDARRLLDSLSAEPVRLDLADAVRAAARAVTDDPLPAANVVVFSDLQATGLSPGEPAAVPVLAWEPPELPANRWIEAAYPEPATWAPDGAVIVAVGGAREPTAVRLMLEDRDIARAVGSTGERVVLAGRVPRRGWVTAAVELDADELRLDDRRSLALYAREPARASTTTGVGAFVREAVQVLTAGGRVRAGPDVRLTDAPAAGVLVLFPPADPALVGAFNRALAARGVAWRLGELVTGEWVVSSELGAADGVPVYRRHRFTGSGAVLGRAGGEPWIVRDGDVVLMASRFEPDWTAFPVRATFLPFIDVLINRVAARESWFVTATPHGGVQLPPTARAVLMSTGALPVPSDGRITAPRVPGVYFLQGAAGDTVGALEVNYDVRESDLARSTDRALRASLGDDVRVLGATALERALFRGIGRADFTAVFLAAAIVAAIIEFAVASRGGATQRP